MKVLVFGGTTEGRLLARELSALGAQVTVSVATALGAEELRGVPPLTVCVGRKDTRQMREMLPGFAVCVDATHPYAAEASGNIRAACLAAGVPYRRLLRGVPHGNIIALQGPFTRELNEALMRRFDIGYLVTKDGGAPGGFGEKAQAARNVGARLVVIRRPADSGEDYAAVLNECREMMACR